MHNLKASTGIETEYSDQTDNTSNLAVLSNKLNLTHKGFLFQTRSPLKLLPLLFPQSMTDWVCLSLRFACVYNQAVIMTSVPLAYECCCHMVYYRFKQKQHMISYLHPHSLGTLLQKVV